MFSGIAAWLVGTATGRSVMVGGGIALGVLAGWYLFSSHYESRGYQRCQNEQLVDINKANASQAAENAAKDKLGSEIARDAADAAAGVIKEADKNAVSSKEEISDVYKRPPSTAPVALGSCVHPVDKRVQDRIDRAVKQANR